MYHNSVPVQGQLLFNYESKAQSQEDEVLQLFKSFRELTPSQAWVSFKHLNVPITSIRRAISNLQCDGYLIKTELKRIGEYGRPESIYRLLTTS